MVHRRRPEDRDLEGRWPAGEPGEGVHGVETPGASRERAVAPAKTAEAEALRRELVNYELRVDAQARETFGAFKTGTHDDLATALWLTVQISA